MANPALNLSNSELETLASEVYQRDLNDLALEFDISSKVMAEFRQSHMEIAITESTSAFISRKENCYVDGRKASQ